MNSRRPPPTKSHPPRNIRRGATPSNASTIAPTAARAGGGGMSLQRIIWTGAFAAVTIVGAIYGAGLKTQQEYKSV